MLSHGVVLRLLCLLSSFPPLADLVHQGHFLMALQPVSRVAKEEDRYMLSAAAGKQGKSSDATVGQVADSPLPTQQVHLQKID
jgi:hypothetical protein